MASDRRWHGLILAVVVGLLVLPVVLDSDGLPLSTYPMYARQRQAEVDFVTAQGVDADGDVVPLGLDVIGASDDPLIVAGELRADVRAGRAEERCVEIWQRVSDSGAASRTGVVQIVTVQIVTERHDVIEHTADRPSLRGRTVHAECEAAT